VLDNGSLKIMYYRARCYDPETGRFMQRDPLGIDPAGGLQNPFDAQRQYADGLNIYQFLQNNPWKHLDASGLASCHVENAVKGEIISVLILPQTYDPYLYEKVQDLKVFPSLPDLSDLTDDVVLDLIKRLREYFSGEYGGWTPYIKVDQYVCMCTGKKLEWVKAKVTEGIIKPCGNYKGCLDPGGADKDVYGELKDALSALKPCIEDYLDTIRKVNRKRGIYVVY